MEDRNAKLPDAAGRRVIDLDMFLDALERSEKAVAESPFDRVVSKKDNRHRKLTLRIAEDRMSATLDAVFPDTEMDEVLDTLAQGRVQVGIQDDAIASALQKAREAGRAQRGIVVAVGEAPRGEAARVIYRFLSAFEHEADKALGLEHPAFKKIGSLMRLPKEHLMGSCREPVVAVPEGACLIDLQSCKDKACGYDVFGDRVAVSTGHLRPEVLPGHGVCVMENGAYYAEHYGYVCLEDGTLSVISPFWVAHDALSVFYIKPDQIGNTVWPSYEELLHHLGKLKVTQGISHDVLKALSEGMDPHIVMERRLLVARGKSPGQRKSHTEFFFQRAGAGDFDDLRRRMESRNVDDALSLAGSFAVVRPGQVMAIRSLGQQENVDGHDVFGNTLKAEAGTDYDRTIYKAGINVVEQRTTNRVSFVSEIYGYACVDGDRICVISPLIVTRDWMHAFWVSLPQTGSEGSPQITEVADLFTRAHVRRGIDREAVLSLCRNWVDIGEPQAVLLAQGEAPKPGVNGTLVFHFTPGQAPGQALDDGRMDFKERATVEEAKVGDLLAERVLPKPGKAGFNVRGKELPFDEGHRDLLFTGRNVRVEERNGQQFFYATESGWPRVIKDTLVVTNRFRTPGNVDFHTGNLDMDGDIEIEGDVKSGFRVRASGAVFIAGSVEQNAEIIAGEHIIIKGGAIGARLESGLGMDVRFLLNADVSVGSNLWVGQYIQDSNVYVQKSAVVQGNGGGERAFCVVGGTVMVVEELEVLSAGTVAGRTTRLIVGIDAEIGRKKDKLADADEICLKKVIFLKKHLGVPAYAEDWRPYVNRRAKLLTSRAQFHDYLDHIKDLEKNVNLRIQIQARLDGLQRQGQEREHRARVRVQDRAFPGTIVQVGSVSRTLDKVIRRASIRIAENGRLLRVGSIE